MPTSPFGLAYGLGAGLSAIPTVMNQRANEQMAMQMKQLQFQQMQRQQAEAQATQQASMQVKPEMEQVAGLTPQNMNPTLGTAPASPDAQQAMNGLGLPGGIPNAPTSAQMAQVQGPLQTTARQKIYTTPHQAASYRYGAMSNYLFNQGFPDAAIRLQQLSSHEDQQHRDLTTSNAGTAAMGGAFGESLKMLRSIGINFDDMGKSPDDPNAIRIYSTQNGQKSYADIPYKYIGAIIKEPAKAGQIFGTMDWHVQNSQEATKRAQLGIASRENIAGSQIASRENISGAQIKSREDMAAIRASMPGGYAGRSVPADLQKVAALKDSIKQLNPDISDAEATAQAWYRIAPGIDARGKVGDTVRLRSLQQEQKQYLNPMGQAPSRDDSSERSKAYWAVQDEINGLRGKTPIAPVKGKSQSTVSPGGLDEYLKSKGF